MSSLLNKPSPWLTNRGFISHERLWKGFFFPVLSLVFALLIEKKFSSCLVFKLRFWATLFLRADFFVCLSFSFTFFHTFLFLGCKRTTWLTLLSTFLSQLGKYKAPFLHIRLPILPPSCHSCLSFDPYPIQKSAYITATPLLFVILYCWQVDNFANLLFLSTYPLIF
jgi:hypothetical protein